MCQSELGQKRGLKKWGWGRIKKTPPLAKSVSSFKIIPSTSLELKCSMYYPPPPIKKKGFNKSYNVLPQQQ